MLVPQTLMIGLLVLAVACLFWQVYRAYLVPAQLNWEGLAMVPA